MKKNYDLTLVLICCTTTFGFTQIFDENCSTKPSDWTFNSVAQESRYSLLDNSDDYVISETFEAYDKLELVTNLRSNRSGSVLACPIEIAGDGGSTWTARSFTQNNITKSYTNYTFNIGSLSGTDNKIRRNKISGNEENRTLRIDNLELNEDAIATGDCASESFSNIGDSSSYITRNWIGDNGIDWTATDTRTDEDLDGDEAIVIRSGSLTNDTSFPGGCGIITFDYARKFNNNSTLKVFINGTQYGSDISVAIDTSNTFSTTVNVSGPIDVELRNSGNRTIISNLSWTCYTGSPNPELQLVDNTSTNQNCGYTIDYGSQAISTNTDLTFDIENNGSADLDVSAFNVTGDYTIVSPATPFSITSGNTQTITVRFTPTVRGTRTGSITINNNDLDEGTCTVNLTGEGYTPAPEIDVEENTRASIPSGATPSIGHNTIFAATVMGNSTAPKTYYVHNEGTANLDLTSITSSNPTEFPITLNPGSTTIASGSEEYFEITFTPNGVGTRTATITIINNDADENPYTFEVQGTGECAAGTLTLSPATGPIDTVVYITSTISNFGSFTTATVNGISATLNVTSTSELEVTIPTGATTGSIEITDDLGCLSSELFTVIDQKISSCEGGSGTTTDLFISEVTDHGSGSHSYVEIFNGTGSSVNLANYEIRIHNNGNNSPTSSIALSGTIANNDVFVFAFGGTNATDNNATHGYDQASNVSGINENDNIRLYKSNVWIDLWGDTAGSSFTVTTKNYTYRRKNSGITAPSTTWNASDWDSFTPVDYTDIGTYDFSLGSPPIINNITATATACNEATVTVSATEGYAGGNALQYVWYVFKPEESSLGWKTISNGGIYTTSSASPDLIISNANSVLSYQYYCEVRENDASCFEASTAIQINIGGAIWDGTTWVWDDGTVTNTVPTLGTNVIINGNYDTSTGGSETSFKACECTINAPYTLTIENDTYVVVGNNFTVNGNVIVKTDGSFVQINDDAIIDGAVLSDKSKIQVEKETSSLGSAEEYTYWSAPVSGETIGSALADARRIFWYNGQNYLDATREVNNDNSTLTGQDDVDDNGDDWQYTSASGVMITGVGYAATHNSSSTFPGQFTYIFEGPFNNGIYNIPIYRNDSETNDNNWNLIGNPYPSALDADLFLSQNTNINQSIGATNGAIYLWSQATPSDANANGNQGYNYAQSDYAIINGTGQTMGGDGILPTRHIPSGQGFFVSMDNNATATVVSGDIKTSQVVFNNSMRVTENNTQFFRTTSTANKLWLNLTTDNGIINQILIAYLDGATDDDDGTFYDAKRNNYEDIHAIIYSNIPTAPENRYVIQAKHSSSLTLDEIIPFGFKTTITEPTIYSLSISQLEGDFLTTSPIYLYDKLLNKIHELSESEYVFTSETGTFEDRFELVFSQSTLSVNDATITTTDVVITELNNGFVKLATTSNTTISKVVIFDMLGRRIYSLNGNNSTEIYDVSKLSRTAYIAQITLANGQTISKKAIKKQ
ncbi:choice-of-anchor D domain-containing protein [Formosa sediminum]|uniref:Choice-of-anchor D domain-containing protein n=1 Tax=Formosa sediminum TaxID=2594004 RepID=A0A516GPE1_9FLAO|nr:choice-of-anchor D domain-containing protein [Formosa sediminum]QDO93386.1 choice-of-anchor D domain-containing protein [Formosa sediminum]